MPKLHRKRSLLVKAESSYGSSSNPSGSANYLEVVDLDLYKTLNDFVRKAFEQYTSVYSGILQNNDPVSTWTTKVQKTKAGGGYHQWHCENGQFLYRDRVLAWMVYLNTVKEGGGTYFSNYDLTINAVEGRLVLWPPYWTHMHKGVVSKTSEKYIATGWFCLVE